MAFPRKLEQLCTPSLVYFMVSIFTLIYIIFQNLGHNNMYKFGSFSCFVPSTVLVLSIKLVYILFWTWILNLICKDGHSGIAWLLVLFPFILLFVIIGLIMMNQNGKPQNKKNNR